MSWSSSRSDKRRGAIGRDQPALDGLGPHALDADAGAVVGDLDDDMAALLHGAQAQRAFRILARGFAHFRRLDAMVERVADGMGERILDGLEQALVQLRLLSFHLQANAAMERLRQIAHDTRHLRKDVRHRLHPSPHDRLSQVRSDHVEAARQHGLILGSADVACST